MCYSKTEWKNEPKKQYIWSDLNLNEQSQLLAEPKNIIWMNILATSNDDDDDDDNRLMKNNK